MLHPHNYHKRIRKCIWTKTWKYRGDNGLDFSILDPNNWIRFSI